MWSKEKRPKTLKKRKTAKKGKNELKAKTNKANNPQQGRIDGSRFGLGKQKLLRKRNLPKMAKTAVSAPKRSNSAKKGYASTAKLLTNSGNAETH